MASASNLDAKPTPSHVTTLGITRAFAAPAAMLLLAVLSLAAVFADLLACDGPVLLIERGAMSFLPTITHKERFAGMRGDQIVSELEPSAVALWPLVRSGPSIPTHAPALSPPSREHPLGTDAFRRDVFARLVHGARVTLGLGATATALAMFFGFIMGASGAAFGGSWDGLVERATEVTGIYPAVIVIALVRAIEPESTLTSLLVVVTVLRWAEIARLSRVLTLRSFAEEWALATRALGASRLYVIVAHVARAGASTLLTAAAFSFGSVVLVESALSFLGLGVPSAFASWGEMMGEISAGAGPLVVLLPALALAVTVGSLHILADAAGRSVEPRFRTGRA